MGDAVGDAAFVDSVVSNALETSSFDAAVSKA